MNKTKEIINRREINFIQCHTRPIQPLTILVVQFHIPIRVPVNID